MIKDEFGNRRFYGVYRGIVQSNSDPLNKGRLKLQVPQVLGDAVTGWAWATHRPGIANVVAPVGTAVWVMFEGGDPSFPMWIGLTQELPLEDIAFVVEGGSLGTQPTFSGAPLFTGSYVKNGPLVTFRIDVEFDNITSFGTGQYYLTLPFVPKHNYQLTNGCLHDISTGVNYVITGHVYAGNSQMRLESTDNTGNTSFNIPFTYNHPVTLTTADNFHIAGTYVTEE
jgi:hypothetical protein